MTSQHPFSPKITIKGRKRKDGTSPTPDEEEWTLQAYRPCASAKINTQPSGVEAEISYDLIRDKCEFYPYSIIHRYRHNTKPSVDKDVIFQVRCGHDTCLKQFRVHRANGFLGLYVSGRHDHSFESSNLTSLHIELKRMIILHLDEEAPFAQAYSELENISDAAEQH